MVDSKKAVELAMFAPLSPLSPVNSALLGLCLWIPMEILEQIVGYCRDDRATLRACSLASRVLRPAAQRYLFHNLVFHNASGDPYMRLSYIQAHPHLSRRVKSISYAESVDHGSWTTFAQFVPTEMRLRSAHFAVRGTTATAVSGDDLAFPESNGLASTFAAPTWNGLTALSIRGATFPSADVFAAMLAPLRALRLLELDPVMIHPSPADTPICKPTFTQPCTLRLSFFQGLSSLGAMLPWLAAGAAAGNVVLQVLSVPLQSTDLRPLEGALACCGSGVSMLQLVGAAYVREDEWALLIPLLAQCTNLRILSLDTGYIPNPVLLPHLARLIRTCCANLALVSIDTGRLFHMPDALDGFEWEVLDEAAAGVSGANTRMVRPGHPELRGFGVKGGLQVQLSGSVPSNWDETLEADIRLRLAKLLPRLAERGRFRFVAKRGA